MPGVAKTMEEWKAGKLHSGSKHGKKVTSQKQAIAIALSEEHKDHHKKNSGTHAHLDMMGKVKVSHSMVSGCSKNRM